MGCHICCLQFVLLFFFVRVIVLYFFEVCIALFIYFVFMYLCLAYSVSYSDQVLCQFVISFFYCASFLVCVMLLFWLISSKFICYAKNNSIIRCLESR